MYWFMRMKQGTHGNNFTLELWCKGRVGVMFGTWIIEDVQDGTGGIDESKISQETLEVCANRRVAYESKSDEEAV